MQQQLGIGNKETLPPVLSGGAFHMQGIADLRCLYIYTCEWFLKVKGVWCTC